MKAFSPRSSDAAAAIAWSLVALLAIGPTSAAYGGQFLAFLMKFAVGGGATLTAAGIVRKQRLSAGDVAAGVDYSIASFQSMLAGSRLPVKQINLKFLPPHQKPAADSHRSLPIRYLLAAEAGQQVAPGCGGFQLWKNSLFAMGGSRFFAASSHWPGAHLRSQLRQT